MNNKKVKSTFFNMTTLIVAGVVLLLLSAVVLLWHGNANSNQAFSALIAKVYFDGEYKISDGEWHDIEKGEHIPSTQGDVTLRGNFHMLTPDGEYVGLYGGDLPIALYTNHINVTICEGVNEPYVLDMENPLFGDSACGVGWSAYVAENPTPEPMEIRIHNPHSFGNEKAVDQLLEKISLWSWLDFEKDVIESGENQRNLGIVFIVVSLLILGFALFSTLIHTKNSRIIWVLGFVVLFAGVYLIYSADGVSFWSESVVSNTTLLGCSMMLYMMFLSMALVCLLKGTRKIGIITIAFIGAVNTVFFILPILTDILFYDTWLCWAVLQTVANVILIGCLIREFCTSKVKSRWILICSVLPLISFIIDFILINFGVCDYALISKYVFIAFFIVAMITVLKIIPGNINKLARAKELETEKVALNAQLTESRISTMMSQIRPHFIYNTLGSIEQLCELDPPKAGELVHNFAKYLRGNFGELDSSKPILMSQEMEHVHYYISIEKVRFPDMAFSFEMNSNDFHIPALTIQPIVENAVKHGLMKLSEGGTIRVVSYETDTHYCVSVEDDGVGFDTGELSADRNHVGIRNIKERLTAMVNGTLDIESLIGAGTKVLIKIPKEGKI